MSGVPAGHSAGRRLAGLPPAAWRARGLSVSRTGRELLFPVGLIGPAGDGGQAGGVPRRAAGACTTTMVTSSAGGRPPVTEANQAVRAARVAEAPGRM